MFRLGVEKSCKDGSRTAISSDEAVTNLVARVDMGEPGPNDSQCRPKNRRTHSIHPQHGNHDPGTHPVFYVVSSLGVLVLVLGSLAGYARMFTHRRPISKALASSKEAERHSDTWQ